MQLEMVDMCSEKLLKSKVTPKTTIIKSKKCLVARELRRALDYFEVTVSQFHLEKM